MATHVHSMDTPAVSSRRTLFVGTAALALALAGAGALATTAAHAATTLHPDAELIARCQAFIAATAAYDADGGSLECDDDPLWHRLVATRDALDGMAAVTFAGVAAKAEVALFLSRQPDGSENFSRSYTGDWPEQVVRDLLLVTGGAA